jgi:hypothetical protein
MPAATPKVTIALSADYSTLVPVTDTVNALLTSLPAYDLNLYTDQLEAGNLLAAVGDPIAADLALVPFAFGCGAAAPVLEAAAGTPINLVDLIAGPDLTRGAPRRTARWFGWRSAHAMSGRAFRGRWCRRATGVCRRRW